MTIASGARVVLGYVEEVTHGVTPAAPILKTLRTTSRNVNLEKEILVSQEVRSTRFRADVRHGFNSVAGNPGFQLSLVDYDDFLQYGLGSSGWVSVTTGVTTLDATAPSTFSRAAGSFITDGFRPGDWITVSGFVAGANNGLFLVLTVAALSITVSAVTLVTEAGTGDELILVQGKRLNAGQTLTTITLERQFQDVTQFQPFRGVAINQTQISVTPKAIAGGSFTLLGMSAGAMDVVSVSGSPPTAPSTNTPFAAFEGGLYENGILNAVVTSIEFTVNNNRSLEGVIGSRFSPDVFEGDAIVTGTMTVFFENATMFNKFVNETESSIWLKLLAPNLTDFMVFVFPRVKYTGGSMDPPQRGPVPLVMPFEALEHATYAVPIYIQRSNV